MSAPSPRAAALRRLVQTHRAIGTAAKPRKPPRAAPPDAIRRDYQRALMALAARLRAPFEVALEQLRPIIERAAIEHRADTYNPDQPRDERGRFGEGGGGGLAALGERATGGIAGRVGEGGDPRAGAVARERTFGTIGGGLPAWARLGREGVITEVDPSAMFAAGLDVTDPAPDAETRTGRLMEGLRTPEGTRRIEELHGVPQVEVDRKGRIVSITMGRHRIEAAHRLGKKIRVRFVRAARADDRADADEGAAVRALIARLKQQFADAIPAQEVQDLAKRFAAHTSTYQRVQFNAQTKAALGIDVVTSDAKLARIVDAFVHANVALVTGIGPRLASDIESAALSAVQHGRLWPDLADDLRDRLGIAEDRARLIARDQVGKAYADIDQARQRDLGVTRFVWRTVHDERVRGDPDGIYPKSETSHYDLDGKTFAYADPPLNADGEAILPGDEINCRCTAEPVWDDVLGDDND